MSIRFLSKKECVCSVWHSPYFLLTFLVISLLFSIAILCLKRIHDCFQLLHTDVCTFFMGVSYTVHSNSRRELIFYGLDTFMMIRQDHLKTTREDISNRFFSWKLRARALQLKFDLKNSERGLFNQNFVCKTLREGSSGKFLP